MIATPPHDPGEKRAQIHVYCEDQGTATLITTASRDRRLTKMHLTTQMGGVHAACSLYAKASTPALVIVESLLDGATMLADLERLAEVCDAETKVIVIGHINDVLLYRELLRRHISDYLVAPLTAAQAIESITAVLSGESTAPLGRITAFIGAKGGCGSSTVCHNVAWMLAEGLASETVITDFDLPFGTLGLDFNQDAMRGMGEALATGERLDIATVAKLRSKCSDHLSLLTAPCALGEDVEINVDAAMHLTELLSQSAQFVALDMPRAWGAWARQLIAQADEIVITAEPDLASLRNTKNIVDAIGAIRGPGWVPLLVLNRVNLPRRQEITLRDFANAVEVRPAAVIEFDAQLFGAASNNGQMIGEVSGKAKATDAFRDLAAAIAGKPVAAKARGSVFSPIIGRLSRKIGM
jgi:pilus assembly protein CpaE